MICVLDLRAITVNKSDVLFGYCFLMPRTLHLGIGIQLVATLDSSRINQQHWVVLPS